MNQLKTFFFLVSCLLIQEVCFSQKNKDDWHIKKRHKGIEVYSRKTANSEFRELKSVMYLKTSLNSVVALVNDRASYPEWVYKCGEAKTLRKISESELIHYQTVTAPWPAEDRDFIVTVKLAQDEKTKVVTMISTCNADYTPPVANYVRIRVFSASWTFIPLKDGNIQLVYQLLVHPGGLVPAWLVNMAAIDGPYETMFNMKEWVFKEKYQKAKNPIIKEVND
jgi:hypothetical protein